MRFLLFVLAFSLSCTPTSNRRSCANDNDCENQECRFGFCSDAASSLDAGPLSRDVAATDALSFVDVQNLIDAAADVQGVDAQGLDASTADAQPERDPFVDEGFGARVSFRINSGGATFEDFPVPLVISKEDVRFDGIVANEIDIALADGTRIPFEISDDDDEKIIIWLKANLEADLVYYVYFDNPEVIDLQRPADVWDEQYLTVMHMGDSKNSAPASANASDFGTNQKVVGDFGAATNFAGNGGYIIGRDVPGFSSASGASACQFIGQNDARRTIFGYSIFTEDPDEESFSRFSLILDDSELDVLLRTDDDAASQNFSADLPFDGDETLWICVVADLELGQVSYFANADLVETFDFTPINVTFADGPSSHAAVGSEDDGLVRFFSGTLDEVFISRVARSQEYLALQYRAMRSGLIEVNERENQERTPHVRRVISVPALDEEGVLEDTPLVLAGEGFGVRVSEIIDVENGQASTSSQGGLSFWPEPNYFGDARVRFRVTDGENLSDAVELNINVESVNDVPTLAGATVTGAISTTLTRVLRGADVEDNNDTLTYALVSAPDEGVTTLTQNTLSFEAPAEAGTYVAQVQVSDSDGGVRNALIRFVTTTP